MTDEELQQKLYADLIGTSGVYDQTFADQYGITVEKLETQAELSGLNRCEVCGWWCDESECLDFVCEDCQE